MQSDGHQSSVDAREVFPPKEWWSNITTSFGIALFFIICPGCILLPILFYSIIWFCKFIGLQNNYAYIIFYCISGVLLFLYFLFALYNNILDVIVEKKFHFEDEQKKKLLDLDKAFTRLEVEYVIKNKELERQFKDNVIKLSKETTTTKKLLEVENKSKLRELEAARKQIESEHFAKEKELKEREAKLYKLLESSSPFKDSAILATDMKMAIFDNAINYLRNKMHPGATSAECVKRIKRKAREIVRNSKEIEYKYEYILKAFPEIGEYVDNDEDLISIGEHLSYSDLDDVRDRRKDYLSKDEYDCLSDSEKSQLALDRYIQNRKKDKWQIGRDYEMSCAFQLKSRGYHVEMHGIKYKLSDLGRDLIATKHIGGGIWDRGGANHPM